MHDLVIARYDEDLRWIEEVPACYFVTIFNKGQPLTDRSVLNRADFVYQTTNRGFESETYIRHIIDGPEAKSEYTVFSQGNPLEHSPDFISLLDRSSSWDAVQPLSWCWKRDRGIPPEEVLTAAQAELPYNGQRIRPEPFSLFTWNPVAFYDWGAYNIARIYREKHGLALGTNLASHFLGLCGNRSLAIEALGHQVGTFSYGGLFAVTTDRLASLRNKHGEQMWQFATEDSIYGYMLERLWLHMFGVAFKCAK